MKKFSKFILPILPLIPLSVISCGTLSENSKLPGYRNGIDFGVAIPEVNTLNYIKTTNLDTILTSLVEGVLKNSEPANTSFGNQLSLPIVDFAIYQGTGQNTTQQVMAEKKLIKSDNRKYTLSNSSFTTGVAALSTQTDPTFIGIQNDSNSFTSVLIKLNNGASKWSNGETVTAQDFIDGIQYILDINTGSQKLVSALKLDIRNSQKIVDLQNEYYTKFGKTYINPFGRRGYVFNTKTKLYEEDLSQPVFQSQNPGDEKLVKQIQEAAKGFGLYTGRIFNELSNQKIKEALDKLPNDNANFTSSSSSIFILNDENEKINIKLTPNPFLDPEQAFQNATLESQYKFLPSDEYQLRLTFEDFAPKSIDPIVNMFINEVFKPVNRRFVESIGGIHEFGITKEKFLWNGPFNLDSINLGPQGNALLTKRDSYYSAAKTVSDKIKVYFADSPELLSTLFEEGYISYTKVPSTFQQRFWSNLDLRKYMAKSQGFGTIALQMNLDNVLKSTSYLKDEDLRKAIYYAINRENLLKLTGWDSSMVVNTWTAFEQAKTNRGINLETFFDEYKYVTEMKEEGKDTNLELPLQSLPFLTHLGKHYNFEAIDRTDPAFQLKLANYFLDKFKKKHPDLKNITLDYIYKSDEEGTKAGIGIQNLLENAFGGFIKVELKGVPSNIYISKIAAGEFDLTYQNFDKFGQESFSYIMAFFSPDEILPEYNKTTGFETNPSGSFTYKKWWDSKTTKEQTEIRNRLKLDDFYFDKFLELISRKEKKDDKGNVVKKPLKNGIGKDATIVKDSEGNIVYETEYTESITDFSQRAMAFFNNVFTPEESAAGWDSLKVFRLIALFEIILREAAPIVPLMEVDTNWRISRLGGISRTFTLSLQYAYDYNNPPKPNLPVKN